MIPFVMMAMVFVAFCACEKVGAINSYINLSIDGTAEMDLSYSKPTGGFSRSSLVTVSVTSDYEQGYTLSIAGASDGRLTGSDGENGFESIPSIISSESFAGESGSIYNNKWGLLPSKYYEDRKILNNTDRDNPNCATPNCDNGNPNYLPAPTDAATVLDITSEANPTEANVYTLGFGARVDAALPPDTYSGDFVVTAVSNLRIFQVTYEGFEDTTGFPTFVVDGLDFSLSYNLKDEEYYNIYMNGAPITMHYYTVEDGVLTVQHVVGDLKIVLQTEDDFTEHEPEEGESVTKNGITITSVGSGVYTINGTTTRESFVRLSDYFFIANTRADLMSEEAPADEAILKADKYYDLDVVSLDGTQSATENDQFRVVFREKGTVDVMPNLGYDFVTGRFGHADSPLGVDVGMLSLYIKKDVVFDNFKFRIAIYEVDPGAKPIVFENEECGMTVSFYTQKKVIEYNGRTLKNCFVDISGRTGIYTANPNTVNSDILYPAGTKLRVKYQYMSGYPVILSGREISFVFRNKNKYSSGLAAPKLTTLDVLLNEDRVAEGELTEDVTMFSGFVTYGITFDHFRFRVNYEVVEDELETIEENIE